MKKGFTLIELLIVTVVIVTLMGIVFRLAGLGSGSGSKAMTISRMQRIENALSGYYAAYGSYPPVHVHGTRDIYTEVDAYGIQDPDNIGNGNRSDFSGEDPELLKQIDAACRSQPFGVQFPVDCEDQSRQARNMNTVFMSHGDRYGDRVKGGFNMLENGVGGIPDWESKSDWRDVHLFKYGVMSYLLPRYLFMLNGHEDVYKSLQWRKFNQIPCRLDNGNRYNDWNDVRATLGSGSGNGSGRSDAWMITNMASQAVCARWMPNFENIAFCFLCDSHFYGVDIKQKEGTDESLMGRGSELPVYSTTFNSSSQPYALSEITVLDGWKSEFYYYSEPPYQSYRLWSAGPNTRTFPPWIDINKITSKDNRQTVQKWIEDDVVYMSN